MQPAPRRTLIAAWRSGAQQFDGRRQRQAQGALGHAPVERGECGRTRTALQVRGIREIE
jgi:hypothetical protein